MKVIKVISTAYNSTNQLLTKLLKSGRSDVQEVKTASIPGIDSNPTKDMIALYETTDVSGENFVVGFILKDRIAKPGETRIFATDENGVVKNYIYLRDNGDIEFGGTAGNLVRYQELETAFNELNNKFNTFISNYNTHIHPTPSGASSPPTVPGQSSTADITGAKIDKFKTL